MKLEPGSPPQSAQLAIQAFLQNRLIGFEQTACVLGYDDLELLVTQLQTISAFQAERS